jgi:hypothetical protein
MPRTEAPLLTVYLTKHALTSGIEVVEAEICLDRDGKPYSTSMIAFRNPGAQYDEYAHGEGRDWHRTPEAALARAEDMRKKRIATLKKQIKKLEGLVFNA